VRVRTLPRLHDRRLEGARTVIRSIVFWTLRAGLGALFTWTGVIKLADPSTFATEIQNYQLFTSLAPIMAASMPALEVVLGLALLAAPRPWARAGALATGGLMLVFTIAVTTVIFRGINISCGCFGADSGPITWLTVLRDLALLAACAVVYTLADRTPSRPDPPLVPAP
jgi:uncharacterized membrane protein YphA (DoxX/SURF4 family)